MKTCKSPGRLQLVLLCVGMSLVALPARAVDYGVSAGVGTLGAGLGVTFGVTERLNTRIGFGYFSEDDLDFEESGVTYVGEVTVGGVYGLLDFHPTGGGFRVSGGLVLNNNELTGESTVTSNIPIGGGFYTVDRLSATANFDDVAPYIGIGWGNAARSKPGWGFSFDLGVMIQGDVNVALQAEGGDANDPAFQDDLRREEEALANELEEYINIDVFPVVALGAGYTF